MKKLPEKPKSIGDKITDMIKVLFSFIMTVLGIVGMIVVFNIGTTIISTFGIFGFIGLLIFTNWLLDDDDK